MTFWRRKIPPPLWQAALCAALLSWAVAGNSQVGSTERTFRVPKQTAEKALEHLQPSMHGRLPALEGFAVAGDHPLSRYTRAFYQCTVQVSAKASGESLVRVTAKVTAWYSDGNGSHSGYELLKSNGRLEADLLDQLSEQLGTAGLSSQEEPPAKAVAGSSTGRADVQPKTRTPLPLPQTFLSSIAKGFPGSSTPVGPRANLTSSMKRAIDLQDEAANLEEVIKNQAHPKNLVAVKKSGTTVASSPNPGAKTLFLASAHDEFELLDFNRDWAHVRISGLSRGWIRRASLEMPEGIPDVPQSSGSSALTADDLFRVNREEAAPFPGNWEPLRGKRVKIISVQEIQEDTQNEGAAAKLTFAKSLLDSHYEEMAKSTDLSGLVLIFDAADGGMVAATMPTIQRWKAGMLTDAALWHQCYFDPPEAFGLATASKKR